MRKVRRALAVVALTLIGSGIAGAWWGYSELGRTPGELIRYADRRLQGHHTLALIASPILGGLRSWFDEPPAGASLPPFSVPALVPNPALANKGMKPASDKTHSKNPMSDSRIIRVGPLREIKTISMASRLAKDGDIIEIDAGDYRADVASWDRAELTIRGKGDRVRLIASGAHAEGKAIWVIKRGRTTIENIEFIGARVPDRNGAGIRFEQGHLIIRNCLFFNNENGLLATGGDAVLEIENSEFGYNGAGDGQTHNLYAGNIKALKITGSYFHHANVGHLIKSRAEKNDITYNRLSDEPGGRASYELEFPNGGVARVIGNIIQQTSRGSNSTLVSFGAEGYAWPTNALYLSHNTLVNDEPRGGALLRVAPGAQYVVTRNNLLIGKGRFHTPDHRTSAGDIRGGWGLFTGAIRHDYRLNAEGQKNRVTPSDGVNGLNLNPSSEYVHPRQLAKLTAASIFPGAIQTPGP